MRLPSLDSSIFLSRTLRTSCMHLSGFVISLTIFRIESSANSHTILRIFASHLSMANGNADRTGMNHSQRRPRCLGVRRHVLAETDAARIPSRTAFAFTTGQRSSASRRNAEDQRISAFRIKLDFVGDKRECPQLSLLLWCLSVPEALKTDPISGEVRRRKCHK